MVKFYRLQNQRAERKEISTVMIKNYLKPIKLEEYLQWFNKCPLKIALNDIENENETENDSRIKPSLKIYWDEEKDEENL